MIVTVATYLLFLVAFLELVDAIVGFSVYPKISDALKGVYAGTDEEGAEGIVAASSVIGAVVNLIFAAGLAVLAIFDGRGKNVARIITWVIGGLSLCCLGFGLGSNALNGRASRAKVMPIRNRAGRGSTSASIARSARSGSGLE